VANGNASLAGKLVAGIPHPAAKHVYALWTILIVVWIGALDEALRHDFSHLADRVIH